MFFPKENPIGIDISDISVKFAQLQKRSHGLTLRSYGDVDIPEGLLEHDEIINPQGLADFLKHVLTVKRHHTGRLHGRVVVGSLPESKAYVRIIKLPALSPEELVSAVPFEAEQYIPLPMSEVELDWQIVSRQGKNVEVLITATPKEYVEKLAEVFRLTGFVAKSLEVESMAVTRCLISNSRTNQSNEGGSLILDLNTERTSFIVHADNSTQFTASIPVAGGAITQAIASRLNVGEEEAEHLKRLHGVSVLSLNQRKISPETAKTITEIQKAIEPVLTTIYDEIKNTIKFYEGHDGSLVKKTQSIEQILLCGGTSKLPNLADYFQSKAATDLYFKDRKIKISLADPWKNIYGHRQPPFSKRSALSYTTAFGLALRKYF